MAVLHIVCMRPGGFWRGGKRHEGHQLHEIGDFTSAQLREMIAEKDLALILGGETLLDTHAEAIERAEKAAEKPARRG